MPDQPTPKPLDAEAETKVRGLYAGNDWFEAAAIMDAAHYPNMANCLRKNAKAIRGLIVSLDASRAETAALRESLAEVEKELRHRRGDDRFQINPCPYCLTSVWSNEARAQDGNGPFYHPLCKVAKQRDDLLFARDALAAELAEAKRMLDDIDRKAHGFGIGSDNQRLHGICDILAARDSGKASGGGTNAR